MHTDNHPPIVINWHLTEACNYRCRYCFAAWNHPQNEKPLARSPEWSQALLEQLWAFFAHNRASACHSTLAGTEWRGVRLNIAGGEPLLYEKDVRQVIRQARGIGFETSIITNGSLLMASCVEDIAPHLSWLGISIDSSSPQANAAIGRLDNRQRQIRLPELAGVISRARQLNPALHIKVNTVVNAINWDDDLSNVLHAIRPERWKVLRALPVIGDHLTVTDEQFQHFVGAHRAFSAIACVEDNLDMEDSYIMIDPHGRFFQNSNAGTGNGYTYSRPILEAGVEAAFSDINFNPRRFLGRYGVVPATFMS